MKARKVVKGDIDNLSNDEICVIIGLEICGRQEIVKFARINWCEIFLGCEMSPWGECFEV